MRGLEKNCTGWHIHTHRQTHRQTDGHGDSKTNSAKRAELVKTPKETNRKKINDLIKIAAFKEITEMKNSKSKIKDLKYETYVIQPYINCSKFNNHERKLLYSLRSRMHHAKKQFKTDAFT